MARSIILVDSDEAFATALKERVGTTGEREMTMADAGNEALEAIPIYSFGIAIV